MTTCFKRVVYTYIYQTNQSTRHIPEYSITPFVGHLFLLFFAVWSEKEAARKGINLYQELSDN